MSNDNTLTGEDWATDNAPILDTPPPLWQTYVRRAVKAFGYEWDGKSIPNASVMMLALLMLLCDHDD